MSEQPNGDQGRVPKEHAEPDEMSSRSYGRRTMMLGAAAAGAGAAVSFVARPEAAGAASPDAGAGKVKLGIANTATATTSISMAVNGDSGVEGIDTSSAGGYGLYGESANGTGIYGTITGDTRGHFAVEGTDASTGAGGGAGVGGSSTNGTGVYATSVNGNGVYGSTAANGRFGVGGVDSSTDGGYGVSGSSIAGTAVQGTITGDTTGQSGVSGIDHSTGSGGGHGVYGSSTNGTGVSGVHSAGAGSGVSGVDNSGNSASYGVYGSSEFGYAVYGTTDEGYGVYGNATGENATGVYGNSTAEEGFAIWGKASGSGAIGVYGLATGTGEAYGVYASSQNSDSLYVDGSAVVTGALSKGGGSFKIDHPVDPANKYLFHSFVESPDMKNVYDGTITLDRHGRATVELPDWFDALNRDFRYQLTALLGAAPDLHVSALLADGKFSIAGGKADQQVSWQVTGIRQDAWANANRIPTEVDKKAEDHGRYLHPELFGGEAITALAKVRRRSHLTR